MNAELNSPRAQEVLDDVMREVHDQTLNQPPA
jgi:hypothetical protein